MSQGLKPNLWFAFIARAKARAYLRSNSNNNKGNSRSNSNDQYSGPSLRSRMTRFVVMPAKSKGRFLRNDKGNATVSTHW